MPDDHIIPDGEHWNVKEENGSVVSTHDSQAAAETAVCLRTHGDDDLAVATDRAALAPILDALGNHAEAEALLLDALATFEQAYGPEHYELAVTLNNLAAIAQRAGDLPAAPNTTGAR